MTPPHRQRPLGAAERLVRHLEGSEGTWRLKQTVIQPPSHPSFTAKGLCLAQPNGPVSTLYLGTLYLGFVILLYPHSILDFALSVADTRRPGEREPNGWLCHAEPVNRLNTATLDDLKVEGDLR